MKHNMAWTSVLAMAVGGAVAAGGLMGASQPADKQDAKPAATQPEKPAQPAKPVQPEKPATPAKPADAAPAGPNAAEVAKMVEQMSAPAAEHKQLEGLIGTWKIEATIMVAPGQTLPLKGTCTNKWILGKRFVQSDVGEGEGELKIASLTIFGFDTRVKKYTIYGVDTFGTYGINASGDYDKEKKTITFLGETEENGAAMKFRQMLAFEGDDKYTMTLVVMPGPGMEFEVVKLTATRVKK